MYKYRYEKVRRVKNNKIRGFKKIYIKSGKTDPLVHSK